MSVLLVVLEVGPRLVVRHLRVGFLNGAQRLAASTRRIDGKQRDEAFEVEGLAGGAGRRLVQPAQSPRSGDCNRDTRIRKSAYAEPANVSTTCDVLLRGGGGTMIRPKPDAVGGQMRGPMGGPDDKLYAFGPFVADPVTGTLRQDGVSCRSHAEVVRSAAGPHRAARAGRRQGRAAQARVARHHRRGKQPRAPHLDASQGSQRSSPRSPVHRHGPRPRLSLRCARSGARAQRDSTPRRRRTLPSGADMSIAVATPAASCRRRARRRNRSRARAPRRSRRPESSRPASPALCCSAIFHATSPRRPIENCGS